MAAQIPDVWNLLCSVMLHSVLMTKKTPSTANILAEPFSSYFTYLHSFMCHVALVSTYCVCIGHISYSHTFILQVILNRAQTCRYKVSFAMAEVNKLSGILQPESMSLHFPSSISTIMQRRRNIGTKLLNRQRNKHAVWCTKIPAYSCSVLCSRVGMSFNSKQTRAGKPWLLR